MARVLKSGYSKRENSAETGNSVSFEYPVRHREGPTFDRIDMVPIRKSKHKFPSIRKKNARMKKAIRSTI